MKGAVRYKFMLVLIVGMTFTGILTQQKLRNYLFVVDALATATPTATATVATPAATPLPTGTTYSGMTNFGYWGTVGKANGLYGGYVIQQTATASLLFGQVVIPDASNASSVVVAGTGGVTNPIGVVIGCVGATAASPSPGQKFFCNPAAAQKAMVQTSGVAPVVCDRAIVTGTVVMPSASVAGMVTPYAAGTVDEQIGVLLTACATNGTASMLLYK
jgi:hypothetical protein